LLTANDLITGALKRISSYAPGEPLAAVDAQDALDTLNDLLDSWSTQDNYVYGSLEDIFNFVTGQYQYTIGNYVGGTFTGTLVGGSAVISGVTVPSNITVLGDITAGAGVASGATVATFNAGANTVTMSLPATVTVATPQQFIYTIPGNFKAPRPLRITNAFTRITTQSSGLDYPIEIVSQGQYTQIGLKSIQAPWPIALWYNPGYPLGILSFYQAPSTAGELHLFGDLILSNLASLTTQVNLPQGYSRMIKLNLAIELSMEYGRPVAPALAKLAKESVDFVKSLNANPVPVSNYDADIVSARRSDASWILHGGFR
jgi:hypothetical protein